MSNHKQSLSLRDKQSLALRAWKLEIGNWKFQGFTLVELLVVLGVAALIFSLGFAAYREFSRRQQLLEAVNQVKSDLLLAQQRALSGEKPAGCSGIILNGWRVEFGTNAYDITADCGSLGRSVEDRRLKTVFITDGIRKSGGSDWVTFKVLAQGTLEAGDVTFAFTQTATGRTATITVTRTGSVY